MGEMIMTWETLEDLRSLHRETDISMDAQQLYKEIQPHLVYSIDFAEDRVKQLKENWNEELYVHSISSDLFRSKQVKNKSSRLSDDANEKGMTHHLDKLADYILYASYDNAEQKEVAEERKREIKKVRLQRNQQSKLRLKQLIDEQKAAKPHKANALRPSRTQYKILSLDYDEDDAEANELSIQDRRTPRIFYSWQDKELNQQGKFINSKRYWAHFSQKNKKDLPYIFDIMNQADAYEDVAFETLDSLNKDRTILEESLKGLMPTSEEALALKKRIGYINENYNLSVERLRDPMVGKLGMASKEDNKDILQELDYNDLPTMRILLHNFNELHNYYKNRPGTSMWAILVDYKWAYEKLVEDDKLSSIQIDIADFIMTSNDFSYEELQESILKDHRLNLTKQNVNYHINAVLSKIIGVLE